MNIVRQLREQAGLTQTALAELARTSQPTIALYESGIKSPTLATVKRMAAAVGLDFLALFSPPMSREDRRSLAYHRAIVKKLRQSPHSLIAKAKEVPKKTARQHPATKELCHRWQAWLNLPLELLIAYILDPGANARDMRQVSPFAGSLSPQERLRILRRFREEDEQ